MKCQLRKIRSNGMTLPEVSLSMMVLIIFFGVFSIYAKYFQTNIKINNALDKDNKSWIQNENTIYLAMKGWSEILAQPSITKEQILSLKCRYKPNDSISIWGLPGKGDEGLPSGYKYCVFPTSLVESQLDDLIDKRKNSKPGIYFIYAIPTNITSTKKPIRKVFCRPLPFC